MSEASSGGAAAARGGLWGLMAGAWAGAVLTLVDLARVRHGSLPWAGSWSFLGEILIIGLLGYLLPLGAAAALAGVAGGLVTRRNAAAAGSAVTAAVALSLLLAGLGLLPEGPRQPVWLTAPWIPELMVLSAAAILTGWSCSRLAAWAAGRARSGAALALLALLPALPLLPGVAALLLSAGDPERPATAPRPGVLPDIVLITADTLRADRVHGPRAGEIMPVVTGLARRGMSFPDTTAHASWTNPSTASILSGLLPVDHGMKGYGGKIRPGVVTLAQILEDLGYQTAGIVANPLVSAAYGFDRGFRHWDEEPDRSLLTRHGHTMASRLLRAMGRGASMQGTMNAGEVVDRALEVLSGRGERPLFLYLHFMDPHDPYGPPPPHDEGVDPGYQGSLTFEGDTLYEVLRGEIDVDDRDIDHARALYDAEVRYMDGEIGRLMARLDPLLEQGRALVAFTSDHGEEFMEHGSLGHEHTLYQELVHVPMVIARPGHLPEDDTVDEPVAHIDLLPTILEAAGLPSRMELPGRSLVPAGAARAAPADRAPASILSEEDYTGYRAASHRIRSLREGGLKLILYSPNVFGVGEWRSQLFDLGADPGEERPLEPLPPGLEEMGARARAWRDRSAVEPGAGEALDPETEQRLRALGYIE